MASLSSTNTRLSPPPSWSSESNSSSLREASFSSYLNPSEETYIRSLGESSQNQVVSKHSQQHDHLHNSRQKKVEDGEIDVFSADKYFSSGLDHQEHNKSINSATGSRSAKFQQLEHSEDRTEQVVRVNSNKLKVQSRTPSSQSELSSNSQSALLKRLHRTPSRINEGNGKAHQGKTMSLLACSCCARKSVDIDRDFSHHSSRGGISDGGPPAGYSKGVHTRSIKTNLDAAEITRMNKLRHDNNIDPFVFPAVSDSAGLTAINKLIDVEEEEARKSLDVFGFSDLDDGSKRFSLQKRLSMLSWDAIPKTTTDEISTSGAPSETYKDTESDASSDLFEIECLSCTSNPVTQRPRLVPSDGSTTPTTGYAPSEASIEWSVVTASAADFSFASDSEDQRPSGLPSATRRRMASKSSSSAKMSMNKEVQKPVSSMLLGCKSQKAVSVAREVHRKSPARGKPESQRMRRLSDSFIPVTRFQAEAKLPGFVHRHRKSLSPDLLYIQ